MRALFVCTQNICRSRMAEEVFRILTWSVRRRGTHEARSAGTYPDGDGRPLARSDLEWADVVCVMEPEHDAFIRARWPLFGGKVRVLGIPDVYMPGDPALHDLLTRHVLGLLEEAGLTTNNAAGT